MDRCREGVALTKMRPPRIKTIIPTGRDYFAAFLSDKKNEIERRIERVVCWSLIERLVPTDCDEVVGQIFDKETITEVTNVDEEEGFGPFLGYFDSIEAATTALMTTEAPDDSDEEDEDDDDDSDEEDEDDDDDEDSEEAGDDSGSGDDEDWDEDDDDDDEDDDGDEDEDEDDDGDSDDDG